MDKFIKEIASMTREEIRSYLSNKNYKKKKISPVYFIKQSKQKEKEDKK